MTRKQIEYILVAVSLLLIIALAAYFRLSHVHDNPGWFTDEGTHLEVARNVLDGRTQYLAIQDSVLLFSRVPLFGWLLAAAGRLFGLNMTTLRLLTGTLGVISVGLVGFVGWRITREKWLGITAAFILAIFPAAVIYNRFGFSYNLLAPLLLLTCLGLWEYHQSGQNRWLALAALTTGLGIISDLWAISCLPVLILIVLSSNDSPKQKTITLSWALTFALLPIAIFTAHALLTTLDAFLFDLNFVRSRLSLSLPAQIESLAINVTVLLSQNGWIALGFAGFLALPSLRQRRFMLLFILLPLAVLGRSTALHSLGFHYFIPFLPFVALGLAALLHLGPQAASPPNGPRPSWLPISRHLFYLLIAIPLLTTITLLNNQLHTRYQTTIDPFLANSHDAEAVAAYINSHTDPDDLVIANATITWLLNTNRADFQMSIASNDVATPHLPADIPPERYAYDVDYRTAEFVVIDNWWTTWGQFNVPGLTAMINDVTTWPLVFSSGNMRVYQNVD
jgi:4-amino-4-deoxy-L-arabinose transferase-like glycosyltransferase